MQIQRVKRFFKQTDTWRLLGGGLLIVGFLWLWLGVTAASYYGPIVMIPVGLVMFLVASARMVPESEIRQSLEKQMSDLGTDVMEDPRLSRFVLKMPAPWRGEAFAFDENTQWAKRGKDAKLLSDTYYATAIYFTEEHCLLRGRCLHLDGREIIDCNEKLLWGELGKAELIPYEEKVMLTNRRKTATMAKGVLLELRNAQDEIIWRAPVPDDMESEGLCTALNQRIRAARA